MKHIERYKIVLTRDKNLDFLILDIIVAEHGLMPVNEAYRLEQGRYLLIPWCILSQPVLSQYKA